MILVIFDSFLASCYDKISLIISCINFSNLTSSVSPKSPGCFQCKVVFKDQSLGTRGAYSYRVGQFLVLFSAQSQELNFLKDKMHQELLFIHPIKSRTMGVLLILIDLPFGLFASPTPKKKKKNSKHTNIIAYLLNQCMPHQRIYIWSTTRFQITWNNFSICGYYTNSIELSSFVLFGFCFWGDCLLI